MQEWPISGLWVIDLFIGIDMLFSGWSLIMLGFAAKTFMGWFLLFLLGGLYLIDVYWKVLSN